MKQKIRRLFSMLLIAVMMSGLLTPACAEAAQSNPVDVTLETEESADVSVMSDDTINRAEWLSRLTEWFEMTVEEDNYPDNYFTDLDPESEYYEPVMLAVEFGVIDVEAGEEICPEDPCTRDFAASTLNYCLGFQLESEEGYTYSDPEACSYPESAQIAVNRGWFALVNGAFVPDQAITSAEASFMEKDAKAVIASAYVEENYDSSYVFADWVVEIPAGAAVTIDENDVVTIEGADEIIENGDTFVVYPGELPSMYLAETVTVNEDTMIITTSEADEESAVVSVDASGSVGVDLSQFEEADGVEATYIATTAQANAAIATYGIQVEKDSVIATKDIKVADGVKVSVAVNLTDLKLHQKIQTTKGNYYVSVSGTSSITGTVSADVIKANGGSSNVVLGSVRLMGVGKVTVSVDLALDGKISVTYTGDFETGVQYNKKDGFRLVTTFKKKNFCTDSEANAKLGVKVQFGIDIIAASADLSATTGLAAKFTSHTYDDDKLPGMCTNSSGWLYASVGASAKIGIGSFSKTFSKTKTIYDEKNSPVYVSYHCEDTRRVYTCSRKGTTAENGDTVNYKYFTPADSKYGSSSYGGGSSTGTGSNGETYQIYTYSLDEDENATITGYKGNASVLVIPETIDGYTVTSIGAKVFNGNKKIVTVDIPDTVKSIGETCFANCTNLMIVDLSTNIICLESNLFKNCSSLVMVTIPYGVTSIKSSAFENCTSLTNIDIADSVTKIESKAFLNCTSLHTLELSKGLATLYEEAFGNCISLTEVEIPRSLEECTTGAYMSYNALYNGPFNACNNLKKITFEEGTTQVAPRLFAGCTGISEIVIPNTVTKVGEKAFGNCIALKKIIIPLSVTRIDDYAFAYCSKLNEVQMEDGVTYVGSYAFTNCTSLEKIVLSKRLKTLSKEAFGDCTSLTEVEIPRSLEECTTGAYMSYNALYNGPFNACNNLKKITFEEGTTQVAPRLFAGCTGIEEVVLPDTILEIGEKAFGKCTALKEITLSQNLQTIYEGAFRYCTSLESIVLPDSITGMYGYVFQGCTSLESVKLPNTRQNIMEGTFYNCHSLKTVDIPKTLTAVRAKAFVNCYALEEINLPEGVTIFEEYAFNGCSSLKKMETPKNLTEIGRYAFGYCTNLTDVVIGNAVTNLGTGVFYECDALTNVKLGTGITYIPEATFQHCDLLERIVLPYRLKSIGENAFKECTKFTEITIPRATSYIDSTAFSYPAIMTIYGISGTYAEEFANAQNIRFVNQEIKATEVTLSEKELQLNYGASATLALGVTPENFTDEVTWKSTDSDVAVVSDAGVVTARGIGAAVIKVVVGDVSASCKVTVVQPVTSVRLNERSVTMEAYDQKQLQATVSPDNAYNRVIKWTSSDDTIASVDQNGLVTAHQKGTATITAAATDGSGRYAECTVTVTNDAYVITEGENLESPHNYKNNCSDIWIYTKSGAKGLKVTFAEETEVEENFDYLYIYGKDADSPAVYTGTELAGKTIYVSGDTVKIKLVSDNGGNAWGFKVTKIVDAEGNIEEESVCRISGSTRYETSLKIADTFKQQISTTKFETVIIANGRNFPDALAGSYLSGKYNAPILMASEKTQYAEPLRAYIKENLKSGGKIYVLGGTKAVPDSVLDGLNDYQIVRLEGKDRYETNLQILEEANVTDEEILICTGRAFADSLSASATGRPILLVGKALTEAQKAFLQTHSENTYYIIGGENAVSKEIEADLQKYISTTRISGDTRYETSVRVAETFFEDPKTAVLAYAKNFPDGLCGGLLAMSQKAPLILAATGKETAARSYVQKTGIENGVVLGGDGLISDNAVKNIFSEN